MLEHIIDDSYIAVGVTNHVHLSDFVGILESLDDSVGIVALVLSAGPSIIVKID